MTGTMLGCVPTGDLTANLLEVSSADMCEAQATQ